MLRWRAFALVVLMLTAIAVGPAAARQSGPTVRGVLFFSPTCPHCEFVIQEVLPPLFDEHGGPWELVYDETLPETEVAYFLLTNDTLEFLLVDVTIQAGADFFQVATDEFVIGSNGVPRLIVANQVMIGSGDIPERLPGLIDDGLAGDGIDWPRLPGISEIVGALSESPDATATTTTSPSTSTTTTEASSTTLPATSPTLPVAGDADRAFGDDVAGNTVAVAVLLLLLVALGHSATLTRRTEMPYRPGALVLPLVLLGIAIASYLTYVEVGGGDAVCGPVGDCNVVQQSDYATVAGIPIGVIGLLGYLGIGALWLVQRRGAGRRADLARLGAALITVTGVVFSAWLTFLEPFVIHATCAWCIGSALVILALMWLSVPAGIEAWRRLAPVSDVE